MNRLITALAAYAVIAILSWTTLSDEKLKFGQLFEASPRQFVLVLMAALSLLTLLNYWKQQTQANLGGRRRDE